MHGSRLRQGGVGSAAVSLAAAKGTEVVAIVRGGSGGGAEHLLGLGAAEVIDDVSTIPARSLDGALDTVAGSLFESLVRAAEAIREHEAVDATTVAVAGGSQGDGIALAVAALVPDVAAVLSDVPFLCAFERALEIAESEPYCELTRYLEVRRDQRERVFETLAYFDGVAFARRRALFSVGLMDLICPPSTVYAAYNAYAGEKRMAVYPYNDHEGGGAFHQVEQMTWLRSLL